MVRPMAPRNETQILFQTPAIPALGGITLSGLIKESYGLEEGATRRLGSYALVYSLTGRCRYWDERNGYRAIEKGDLMLLFPEIAHGYWAEPADHWDQFFLVFEGAVFDLWRDHGLLDPGNPVLHIEPVPFWLRRMEACLERHGTQGETVTLQQVCRLQLLLAEIFLHTRKTASLAPEWLEAACGRLAAISPQPVAMASLAASLGVSGETFRKQFTRVVGVSPARYRANKMIEHACKLMLERDLSGKEIASLLGFSDEYHFSKRFKKVMGMSPSQFRIQAYPAAAPVRRKR
jgi:AraC-like DNA-binding protein